EQCFFRLAENRFFKLAARGNLIFEKEPVPQKNHNSFLSFWHRLTEHWRRKWLRPWKVPKKTI
ncbi:MAG TPA: hypothetical protein PKA48_03415, partial [Candidatus Obscuribacter sp.]|nr:hypothetical protein [Candidatus Obscuribacter sp.]